MMCMNSSRVLGLLRNAPVKSLVVVYSQLAVMDNGPVEHLPVDSYKDRILLDFAGAKFYAIKDYDPALRAVYGDYMQLPPEEDRVPHQSFIKFYWKDGVN